MEHNSHNEIMRAIGNLEGLMKGMIDRQDVANGRTSKLEDRVGKLEVSDGRQEVKFGIIGSLAGAVGGFLASFLK